MDTTRETLKTEKYAQNNNLYSIIQYSMSIVQYIVKQKDRHKLGLSWANLSLSWGLKLELEVEV